MLVKHAYMSGVNYKSSIFLMLEQSIGTLSNNWKNHIKKITIFFNNTIKTPHSHIKNIGINLSVSLQSYYTGLSNVFL